MIRSAPDRNLTPDRLAAEIGWFRIQAYAVPRWYYREVFVDRCARDPYYIIHFRREVPDAGDGLYDQELLATRHAGFSAISMTREAPNENAYWQTIGRDDLISTLDAFLRMYDDDYIRPPGHKRTESGRPRVHDRLENTRFIYEISSHERTIVGIGPRSFAGEAVGAVCGRVVNEEGEPQARTSIEFAESDTIVRRTTDDQGRFWYSQLSEGPGKLNVSGSSVHVAVLRKEWFGRIRGWAKTRDGRPVANTEIRLVAPDDTTFRAWTDPSGAFVSPPVPAYPIRDSVLGDRFYRLQVPAHEFTVEILRAVNDGLLSGSVHDSSGKVVSGVMVELESGEEVLQTATDARGEFVFTEIPLGPLSVRASQLGSVRGRRISGASMDGRFSSEGQQAGVILQTNDERPTLDARTSAQGRFAFASMPAGSYWVVPNASVSGTATLRPGLRIWCHNVHGARLNKTWREKFERRLAQKFSFVRPEVVFKSEAFDRSGLRGKPPLTVNVFVVDPAEAGIDAKLGKLDRKLVADQYESFRELATGADADVAGITYSFDYPDSKNEFVYDFLDPQRAIIFVRLRREDVSMMNGLSPATSDARERRLNSFVYDTAHEVGHSLGLGHHRDKGGDHNSHIMDPEGMIASDPGQRTFARKAHVRVWDRGKRAASDAVIDEVKFIQERLKAIEIRP